MNLFKHVITAISALVLTTMTINAQTTATVVNTDSTYSAVLSSIDTMIDATSGSFFRQIDLGTNLALPLGNNFQDARFNPSFAARAVLSTTGSYYTFTMPIELATQSINPELGLPQSFLYYLQPERSTFIIRLTPTWTSDRLFSPNVRLPRNCTFTLEADLYYMSKSFATNRFGTFDTRILAVTQAMVRPHFIWRPDTDTYIDAFVGLCFIETVSGRSRFNEIFLPGAEMGHFYLEAGFRSAFPKQKLVLDLQFIVVDNDLNKLLNGDTIIYPNLRVSINKDIFKF